MGLLDTISSVISGGVNAVSSAVSSGISAAGQTISSLAGGSGSSGSKNASPGTTQPTSSGSKSAGADYSGKQVSTGNSAVAQDASYYGLAQPYISKVAVKKSAGADYSGTQVVSVENIKKSSTQGITTYAPWGNYAAIELLNTKITVSKDPGEVGVYQLREGRSGSGPLDWLLVSSGGRAAVQSGAYTVVYPETPVVYTQYNKEPTLASSANATEAAKVLTNPEKYSRLGSEAYGGYVLPLDNRTVESTGAQLSTYENIYNLANLANPQGVNLSKSEAPGANVPWAISGSAPVISYMGTKGLEGEAILKGVTGVDYASNLVTVTPKYNSQAAEAKTYSMIDTSKETQSAEDVIMASSLTESQKQSALYGLSMLKNITEINTQLTTPQDASYYGLKNPYVAGTGVASIPVIGPAIISYNALEYSASKFFKNIGTAEQPGWAKAVTTTLNLPTEDQSAYKAWMASSQEEKGVFGSFLYGYSDEVKSRPLGAISTAMITVSLGALYEGAGAAGTRIAALSGISNTGKLYNVGSKVYKYGIPVAMGGLYGTSVISRATTPGETGTITPESVSENIGQMMPEFVGIGMGAAAYSGLSQSLSETKLSDLRITENLKSVKENLSVLPSRTSEFLKQTKTDIFEGYYQTPQPRISEIYETIREPFAEVGIVDARSAILTSEKIKYSVGNYASEPIQSSIFLKRGKSARETLEENQRSSSRSAIDITSGTNIADIRTFGYRGADTAIGLPRISVESIAQRTPNIVNKAREWDIKNPVTSQKSIKFQKQPGGYYKIIYPKEEPSQSGGGYGSYGGLTGTVKSPTMTSGGGMVMELRLGGGTGIESLQTPKPTSLREVLYPSKRYIRMMQELEEPYVGQRAAIRTKGSPETPVESPTKNIEAILTKEDTTLMLFGMPVVGPAMIVTPEMIASIDQINKLAQSQDQSIKQDLSINQISKQDQLSKQLQRSQSLENQISIEQSTELDQSSKSQQDQLSKQLQESLIVPINEIPIRTITEIPFKPTKTPPKEPIPVIEEPPIRIPPEETITKFPSFNIPAGGGGDGVFGRMFRPFTERFHPGEGVNARIFNIPQMKPVRTNLAQSPQARLVIPQRQVSFKSRPIQFNIPATRSTLPRKRNRYII